MGAAVAASCACCFGLGISAAIWRHVKADHRAQQQRYEALATTDAVESEDEDEDEYDMDTETVDAGAASIAAGTDADLLDFSGAGAMSVETDVAATPEGRLSTMSASSASWVEEMNAELAEVWHCCTYYARPAQHNISPELPRPLTNTCISTVAV